MGLLISFLYLCLNVAVVVFVAYCIVWLMRCRRCRRSPRPAKVGQIIVGLIIIIMVVSWLVGNLLPGAPTLPLMWRPH